MPTTSYLVLTKSKLNQIVIFGQFPENCPGSQHVNKMVAPVLLFPAHLTLIFEIGTYLLIKNYLFKLVLFNFPAVTTEYN